MKVALGGGALTTLVSGPGAFGLVLDAATSTVYFADAGGAVKVPSGGGTATTLVAGQVGNIAVDPTSLYWTVTTTAGSVMKVTPR